MLLLDENTIVVLQDSKTLHEINASFRSTEVFMKDTHAFLAKNLKDILPLPARGKVSKGQNYKDLPYIVSDLPNYFKKDDVFCLRTMFWWGNEFSVAVYLSGKSLEKYKHAALTFDLSHAFCVNTTPWEYDFGNDNYGDGLAISSVQKQNHIDKYGFIKIARRIPIEEGNTLKEKALEFYTAFLSKL